MFGLTYPTVLECVYILTSILSTLSLIYVIHKFSDDVDKQIDEMYLMRKKLETQILKYIQMFFRKSVLSKIKHVL